MDECCRQGRSRRDSHLWRIHHKNGHQPAETNEILIKTRDVLYRSEVYAILVNSRTSRVHINVHDIKRVRYKLLTMHMRQYLTILLRMAIFI